jgi:hypothetical protein
MAAAPPALTPQCASSPPVAWPGWQITLIVAAAALLAAALVVTAYRMRATRHRVTASPA